MSLNDGIFFVFFACLFFVFVLFLFFYRITESLDDWAWVHLFLT